MSYSGPRYINKHCYDREVLGGNPKWIDHSRTRRKWQYVYNMTINLKGRVVGIWAGCIWLWVLSSSSCSRKVNENLVLCRGRRISWLSKLLLVPKGTLCSVTLGDFVFNPNYKNYTNGSKFFFISITEMSWNYNSDTRIVVLTAVLLKIQVFWFVTVLQISGNYVPCDVA
jgi:hypothetical protein